jgi:hypothetical protein
MPVDQATIATIASAIAASLSAIATGLAAYATWRVPFRAAEYAENRRNVIDTNNEKMRLKRLIFFTLMQERAAIYSNESVKALNSIDIIFHDDQNVRDAWAELYASLHPENGIPEHTKSDKIKTLLKEIASVIGLSNTLRNDDFLRIYYPRVMADEENLRHLQRKSVINQLISQSENEDEIGDNTASKTINLFPPKPTISN